MHNVIKFQAPFERLKEYSSSPSSALYKAIIMQALTDATNISERPRDKLIEKEARDWIYGNDDFFQAVCYFGELEPTFVIKITQEAVRLNRQKHNSVMKNMSVKTQKHEKNYLKLANN